ncbi:MAG: DUF2316 family protein, partial [Actinomycetota bacterium]|nr:DUF2316 family protein [Actinomycetota bacterium]
MSLTTQETARTSRELVANLVQSGVDAATVAATLNFSAERLARTVGVTHDSRPADVWLLRDFLDQVNRDRGHTPIPWSVLTD